MEDRLTWYFQLNSAHFISFPLHTHTSDNTSIISPIASLYNNTVTNINLMREGRFYICRYLPLSCTVLTVVTNSLVPFGTLVSISDVPPLGSENIFIGLVGGEVPLAVCACAVVLSVFSLGRCGLSDNKLSVEVM